MKAPETPVSSDPFFFPVLIQLHQNPIIALDMSSNGRFIMSCCEQMFVVWGLRGEKFQSVLTHMSPNTSAVVSPCGRFVACTGECKPHSLVCGSYELYAHRCHLNE